MFFSDQTNDMPTAIAQAIALRNAGVYVVIVTMSSNVNVTQMGLIAFNSSFVINATSAGNINTNAVINALCKGRKITCSNEFFCDVV